MVAYAMNKYENQPPVLVQISEGRALGIMAESSSWHDFAWSVSIPTDVRVLDEWVEHKCRFVTIDWSGR